MKDEQPYVVLTHHHDGRVLAVVVDGEHKTPQEVKDGIAALAERSTLLAERDGARALTVEYRAALELCERRNEQLRAACDAAYHALKSYEHGNSAPELAKEVAGLLAAALKGAGDGA